MNIINEKLRKISKSQNFLLIVVCVLFGLVMSQVRIANDDSVYVNSIGDSIVDCWKWAKAHYYTWSSRQLINFIWAVVLVNGKIALFFFASISMYVLVKAMTMLFSDDNNYSILLYSISVVMLFPWEIYITAGWVATFTSYFGPQAFALMSLVPIKKALHNEKMYWWDIIFYAICLAYGTNAEQMCVVIFGLYLIAVLYCLLKKNNNWVVWLQFVLSIASIVYTVTCPGNSSRDTVDQAYWFPTYGMMDIIDKADIGLSTTLKWMFVDSNAFIIALCVLMSIYVWKKYKIIFFRVISLIPTVMVLLFGPLKNIFISIFPNLEVLTKAVDYYGSFNVASQGVGGGVLQFWFLLVISICIIVEILLLNDTVEGCVVDLSLILLGVASRCMMGFSATVYASSTRTYASLIFCLMAVSVHIFSQNMNLIKKHNKEEHSGLEDLFETVMWMFIILGFLNLIILVGTAFY